MHSNQGIEQKNTESTNKKHLQFYITTSGIYTQGDLSSLQTLLLNHNKNLTDMPTVQAMRRLTKLKKLYINGSPELKERCAKEKGTEWSKIAHIPYIRIDWDVIKDETF